MLPGAAAASPATSIEPLVLMLTGTAPEPPAAPSGLTGMALSIAPGPQGLSSLPVRRTRQPPPPPAQPARHRLPLPHRRRQAPRLRPLGRCLPCRGRVPAQDRRPGPGARRHRPEHDSRAGQPGPPDGRRERPDRHPHTDVLGSPGRRRYHRPEPRGATGARDADHDTGSTIRVRLAAAARRPRRRPARRPRHRARDAHRGSRHRPPPRP